MNVAISELEVRLADCQQDYLDACRVRSAAYGHHNPELGPRFGEVEELDQADGTVVLLCRHRSTGECLGTTRIQTSASCPLLLESSLRLPAWLRNRARAQISRLAVMPGASRMVKLLLMKACYQYCLATQIRWLVIGARSAALIRNYRSLGFKDVFEPGVWIALASGAGLPHQILALDVQGAQGQWQATRNRLLGFMTKPDDADADAAQGAANDRFSPSPTLQMRA